MRHFKRTGGAQLARSRVCERTRGAGQARCNDFERTDGAEQARSSDFERPGGAEQAPQQRLRAHRRRRAGLERCFRGWEAPSIVNSGVFEAAGEKNAKTANRPKLRTEILI